MKKDKSKKNNSVLENEGHKKRSDQIKLNQDSLMFKYDTDEGETPLAYGGYGVSINFKRTVRVPDDGKDYPLPAGLGNFEIRPASELIDNHSLDDIKDVFMIPMHKEEALWINFDSLIDEINNTVVKKSKIIEPFTFLGLIDNPNNLKLLSETYIKDIFDKHILYNI